MRAKKLNKATVTIILDNYYSGLMPSTSNVERPGPGKQKKPLMAGHGFSILVEAEGEYGTKRILFDAGHSGLFLLNNLEALSIDPGSIDTFVLSHGHFDHFMGIYDLLAKRKTALPVVLHKEAFTTRALKRPDGSLMELPKLDKEKLKELGAIIEEIEHPFVLDEYFVVSGEIERKIPFEKPWQAARKLLPDGSDVVDYFIDEISIGVVVKDKGLVVISGCAHAGIINTVEHMENITGEKCYLVIGGFHLETADKERVMKTAVTLKNKGINFVVPCHCTGFYQTIELFNTLKDSFIASCVGTRITIGE